MTTATTLVRSESAHLLARSVTVVPVSVHGAQFWNDCFTHLCSMTEIEDWIQTAVFIDHIDKENGICTIVFAADWQSKARLLDPYADLEMLAALLLFEVLCAEFAHRSIHPISRRNVKCGWEHLERYEVVRSVCVCGFGRRAASRAPMRGPSNRARSSSDRCHTCAGLWIPAPRSAR